MSEEIPDLPQSLPTSAPPKGGFGGFVALLWCLGYTFAMQILPAFVCGIPLYFAAALLDKQKLEEVSTADLMNRPVYVLATVLLLISSHLAGLGFGWFVLRWRVGKSWYRRIAFNHRPAGLHVALVAIGLPALLALATLVDSHLTSHVPSMNDLLRWAGSKYEFGGLEQMMGLFRATPWPLAIFAVAVMPAINEELWCRGFLAQGLSQRYSVWPTVLITSLLFGFLHIDPRHAAGTALLAVAIHFGYLATRSFWIAVALHFANNACAMIHVNEKLNLPILRPFEELAERAPLMLLGGALVLFIPLAYALWQTREVPTRLKSDAAPWKPRSKSGAEIPPTDSGFGITHEPIQPLTVLAIIAGAIVFGLMLVI